MPNTSPLPSPNTAHSSPPPPSAIQSVASENITEEDLAAFFNRSPKTLARWRRERTSPPFVKVGSTILYPAQGVREWLKRREISVDAKSRSRRG